MKQLPNDVAPYRTIGPFTEDTLPKGLLREHNTKAGVWGLLQIESGNVRYVITEPGEEEVLDLSEATPPAVIAPQQKHHLELTGAVQLQITFHR
ncbi:MAG: DUF1971 domain-containing protein [Pseudomonadota bacterium]